MTQPVAASYLEQIMKDAHTRTLELVALTG